MILIESVMSPRTDGDGNGGVGMNSAGSGGNGRPRRFTVRERGVVELLEVIRTQK